MISSFHDFFSDGVVTFMSDRSIDFALKEGPVALSREQQAYLSAGVNFPVENVIHIRQVHGNHVMTVTQQNLKERALPVEADGIVTNTPSVPLAIRTADCLPVFIYDPQHQCIGLIHAGWRSSQKNIVAKALEVMHGNWGCRPRDLRIAFGPAIGKCCCEGAQFKDIFSQETVLRDNAFYLDLAAVNKNQLLSLGVENTNIFDCQACTCCGECFFSYRREGERSGRHLSLMMLKDTKR